MTEISSNYKKSSKLDETKRISENRIPQIDSIYDEEFDNDGKNQVIFGTENIPDRIRKNTRMDYQLVTHDIVEEADVCIIGSGAAGSILANIIHKGIGDEIEGKNVVLIEKGGYYDPEDFNQRELDMMKLLWKNGGIQFNDDLSLLIGQGESLGGSTTINDAVCFDTPIKIMDDWKNNGHVDYTRDDWDAAIREIKQKLNIEELSNTELEKNKNALYLKQACQSNGYSGKNNERNCYNCATCGSCHLGCHYQTKNDMLNTYLYESLKIPSDKKFRVYCNCDVRKINYHKKIATGIEGKFLGQNGIELFKLKVNAKVIILASGSIASSALLLSNNIAINKAGKGLAVHPSTTVIAKFQEEIRASEGIPMAYSCDEFSIRNYQNNGRGEGRKRFFMLESIFTPPAQFSLLLPYELQDDLMKDYQHYAMAGVMVKDNPSGTIELTKKGYPKIEYKLGCGELDALKEGIAILARLYREKNASEVIIRHGSPHRIECGEHFETELKKVLDKIDDEYYDQILTGLGSVHPQGGNMMGDKKKTCVVDKNCKVYGFRNLLVCDASVFPTAVGVNPQITVMALATMTAKNILRSWESEFEEIRISDDVGETCNRNNPRTCGIDTLSIMFNQATNNGTLNDLINLGKNNPDGWTLDTSLLMINNKFHWRGFIPDRPLPKIIRPFLEDGIVEWIIDYLQGFWKRFEIKDGNMIGDLKVYLEPDEEIRIVPKMIHHEIYGDVIKLTYPKFPHVYDLIKIINNDNIVGKIFLSYPPLYPDLELGPFALSKNYSVEWMDEDDHERIMQSRSSNDFPPKTGYWSLRIVDKHLLTNVVKVLDFTKGSVFDNKKKLIKSIVSKFKGIEEDWGLTWENKTVEVNENFMVGKITSSILDNSINVHKDVIRTNRAGEKFFEIRYTLATVAGAWIRDQD